MGRGRDQADVALVTVGAVIGGDRLQPRVLALGSAVGLHRERVVARDLAQQLFQVCRQFPVPLRLRGGRERVQARELRPGDGHHLDRGVQFHGAGTQRDHRPVQRQVPVGEATHVTHHLRLGPVHVEDRMGQVLGGAQQRIRDRRAPAEFRGRFDAEGVQHRREGFQGGGLVHRDAHSVATDPAQVDAPLLGGGDDARLADPHPDRDRVEELVRFDDGAPCPQLFREGGRHQMDPLPDGLETCRAVEDRVEGSHHREKRLGRADVRRGPLTADVLFPGLEGQTIGAIARAVLGNTDEASRHGAFQLVATGHERGVRATETHRDPETLGRTDRDVESHRPWFLQQGQGQQVGGHDRQGTRLVQDLAPRGVVPQVPVGSGIGEDGPEQAVDVQVLDLADHQFDAQRAGPGGQDAEDLRVQVGRGEESRLPALARRERHVHRLRGGGGLVEQGGVGDLQSGQVADHGLEVQQRLQSSLGDLRLIRGVGGVPGRVLEDVALDRRWSDRAVVTLADHRDPDLVFGSHLPQLTQHGALRQRFPGKRFGLAEAGGHGLVDQLVEGLDSDRREHGSHLSRARADVATICEIIWIVTGRVPGAHQPISALYSSSSRYSSRAEGSLGWILKNQEPVGSSLTVSGESATVWLISVITPSKGATIPEVALVDSITTISSPLVTSVPTSGSST